MTDKDESNIPGDRLAWYLRGVWSYFISAGIQAVIVPWILAFVLNVSSDQLGIAQMLSMLPMLLVGLFGGAIADRAELRSHLFRLLIISIFPPMLLAAMILTDNLSYWAMICYAILLSTLGGFIVPARDSLLSRVAMVRQGGNIQHAVALAMGGQFLGQVIGFMLGGTANKIGAPLLLFSQCLLIAFSAFTVTRLLPAPSLHAFDKARSPLRDVFDGLKAIWASDRIRPVLIFQFFGGVLFMGIFMVLFPILVRDVYHGDSLQMGLLLMSFFAGIGLSSLMVSRFGAIQHQGRVIMLMSTISVSVMLLIHIQPPIWAVAVLSLIWGLGSGVAMTISRSIVQVDSSEAMRGRMLAGFQLGSMGGGPIGAALTGYVIHWLGPQDAVLIPCALMLVLWLCVFFFTPLWSMKAPRHVVAPGGLAR